jgi:glycyl-tRNA synthetase beta chain
MDNLLLEIGTEEIPASYIEPALKALSRMLEQKLKEARIDYGGTKILGTPRRLAVIIENVTGRQRAVNTEVLGPPKNVGTDAQGNPTLAAKKFAEKAGVPLNRIAIKETKKGFYLYALKTERGLATKTLLKDILPEVILSTPFPKAMRWADQRLQFARPIHSILSLLGNQVISFALGNIKSGRYTFGHRFLYPGKIKVATSDQYVEILRHAHVMVDINERKKNIEQEISKAAGNMGGQLLPDSELVDTVTHLVEFPAVVDGKFDKRFLNLPEEVLITAMREHQKYFAVIDSNKKLLPGFIAVNNTPTKDMGLVAKGNERVLRARLEDAQFFYKSDLKVPLDRGVEKLKGVMFQATLGSMYEKIERLQKLSEFIAATIGSKTDAVRGPSELQKRVSRAAYLCKADLVSQIVGEFPKLQGVMGRVYSSIAGEPDSVAVAIEEHYRPTYSGGPLPETDIGAILGIADKLDSICGCFRADLIPTGASDPYALRRQGIGIVNILLAKNFSISLREMIKKSLMLFGETGEADLKRVVDQVFSFLKDRIINLLTDEGFSKDLVSAVLNTSVDRVPDMWNRVTALQSLKRKPDFEPLAIAFKRVVNIIKQAQQKDLYDSGALVDSSLFEHRCEDTLLRACQKIEGAVLAKLDKGLIEQALLDIASLRGAVDDFFDEVLVMSEDLKLRRNRLALLGLIAALFAQFADFSKIST